MGSPVNIVVIDGETEDATPTGGVFYAHWVGGGGLADDLKTALRRGEDRWDDPAYLSRVIFCAMVDKLTGTTGYGISSFLGDNQFPYLVVDVKRNVVVKVKQTDNDTTLSVMQRARKSKGISFSSYCEDKPSRRAS